MQEPEGKGFVPSPSGFSFDSGDGGRRSFMDMAAFYIITGAVGAVAAVSGIVLGWKGHAKTARQETAAQAREDATLKRDVEHIKRGVDDLRFELRAQNERYDKLAERVTRVEESAKQAHKRLDRIDEKGSV